MKNLRPNALHGKRTMDTTDWRNQLPPDTRKNMLSKLMKTLRQHSHISGDEGLNKLTNTDIIQFEEKMYADASSQSNYLKRITLRMIAMEKKSMSNRRITINHKSQVQRYHTFHHHPLIRHNTADDTDRKVCDACCEVLDGLYFGCGGCKFWLHEWCAEKPCEIFHPRHPQHQLTLRIGGYLRLTCDECLCDPEEGFCYCCLHCDFMLHIQCAFATINEPPSQHRKVSFRHASHRHDLILYNQVRDVYESPRFKRKTEEQIDLLYCQWCTQPVLSGSSYACIRCDLYFHQACAFIAVPFKIRHHSRKEDILDLRLTDYQTFGRTEGADYEIVENACRTCKREAGGLCYTSKDYEWLIHGKCSTLLPSLKSENHDHVLVYFDKEYYKGKDFSCQTCSRGIDDFLNGFYRCIECDMNFHLSCILPDTVKHRYHWHPLTLMNSTKGDDSDQYYCDICETERNPNHCVYACKECDLCVAHIECAVNQERKKWLELLPKGPSVVLRYMEVKPDLSTSATAVKKWTNGAIVEMRHPFHDHFLRLDYPGEFQTCKGCAQNLTGMAFTCETCLDFDLHETCAELPLQLLNFPLHSHHRLTLKFHDNLLSIPSFICNVCGEVIEGDCFRYQCLQCSFIIDTRCASLSTPSLSHSLGVENIEAKHFSHQHTLYRVPCGANKVVHCLYCGYRIVGLGYRCIETRCYFYLHESCLRQIPRHLKLGFHPTHSFLLSGNRQLSCNLCGLEFANYLGYECSECGDIFVHSICALFQRRTLRSYLHEHVLYYFGRDINLIFKQIIDLRNFPPTKLWFKCNRCRGNCTGAFYRCLECHVNFHMECVGIPRVVKSRSHRHCVKLVDSFILPGYDLDDQYCDVCEEKRDTRDHAYCCERCSDSFVGHVDCVLSKMEQIIEEAPSNLCCSYLDSTDEKVFGNVKSFIFETEKEISMKSDFLSLQCMDHHPTKPWIVTSDEDSVKIWNYEAEELQLEKSFKGRFSGSSKFIEREN